MEEAIIKWLVRNIGENSPMLVLLIAIFYGGYKKIWVWGRELTESEARCGVWKGMYDRTIDTLTSAVSVVAEHHK